MDLKKKYGLPTAISMVVGIIVGSGVFFKAGAVLNNTGGNLPFGILAWLIGGFVMIVCALAFSILSLKVEDANGLVDYMEAMCGKKAGYFIGWYMSFIYLPILTAILAWICGNYTAILFGMDASPDSNATLLFGFGYLITIYFINVISPKLAGKLQISTTVIKLIPLVFIAVVGTIYGLFFKDGNLIQNFQSQPIPMPQNGLFSAIVATAFAYDGWIVVTSINKELNDARKNLPRALIIGGIIVIAIYILYFIGLMGIFPTADYINDSQGTVKLAFMKLMGNAGGNILFVFVIISCLGTLNGLTLATTRAAYAFSSKGHGSHVNLFSSVDDETNAPSNSGAFGLFLIAVWFILWMGNFFGWYGELFIDISEICIVFLYGGYIPIFIFMMIRNKDLSFTRRWLVPLVATLAAAFMVTSCFVAHKLAAVIFLGLVILLFLLTFAYDKLMKKYRKSTADIK